MRLSNDHKKFSRAASVIYMPYLNVGILVSATCRITFSTTCNNWIAYAFTTWYLQSIVQSSYMGLFIPGQFSIPIECFVPALELPVIH